jgi:hypothetical protein
MNDSSVIAHMTAMAFGPLSNAILRYSVLRMLFFDVDRGECLM